MLCLNLSGRLDYVDMPQICWVAAMWLAVEIFAWMCSWISVPNTVICECRAETLCFRFYKCRYQHWKHDLYNWDKTTKQCTAAALMSTDSAYHIYSSPTETIAISVKWTEPVIVKISKVLGGPHTNTHQLERNKRRQACANINTLNTLIKAQ